MQNPSIKNANFDTISRRNWAFLDSRFREENTRLNAHLFKAWLESVDPHIDGAHCWCARPSIMITWKRREAKADSGVTGWK